MVMRRRRGAPKIERKYQQKVVTYKKGKTKTHTFVMGGDKEPKPAPHAYFKADPNEFGKTYAKRFASSLYTLSAFAALRDQGKGLVALIRNLGDVNTLRSQTNPGPYC